MRKVKILGVPVAAQSAEDTIRDVCSLLNTHATHHIATVNPEILLRASKDPSYQSLLNKTYLNTADGFGLWIVAALKKIKLPRNARLTGVDLTYQLLNEVGYSIAIVLPDNALTKKDLLAAALQKKYPDRDIRYFYESELSTDLTELQADIVFVTFGAPRQEQWIKSNIDKLSFTKIVIGVGGTFDFISGTIRRAPKLFRTLGLEWLWRLILEPKRIGRIINAVILFPIAALIYEK